MSGVRGCPPVHSGWFDEERVAKRYVLVQSKSPAAVRCRIEASWLVAVLFRAVVDAPVEGCVALLAMGLDYRDPGGCSFE